MAPRWQRIVRLLQFLRLEVILSAVSNIRLMIFLADRLPAVRGDKPELAHPLEVALPLGAIVAGGLAIYGLALNDAVDARHDRAFSPHRAIPTGAIGPIAAIGLGVLSLLAAVLAS